MFQGRAPQVSCHLGPGDMQIVLQTSIGQWFGDGYVPLVNFQEVSVVLCRGL